MIDTPTILQTTAQATAVIHLTIPREEIRQVMGPGLGELRAALAAQQVAATGPWFTRHFKMSPTTFDFEIGIPVARPVEASGRVRPGELPAMTVARTVYRGGFEGLGGAWPELDGWVAAQGRTPLPSLVETYLTGPSENPDPSTWRTELTRPLLKT